MTAGSDTERVRRFLLISYYFPPQSSSAVYRALNFVRHLKTHGWIGTVVTVTPAAYPADTALDPALVHRVPPDVSIRRTSVLGADTDPRSTPSSRPAAAAASPVRTPLDRFLKPLRRAVRPWLTLPDDKIGWLPSAALECWRALRSRRHDAIIATGGPWTSFVIGWVASRLSGVPLVLDYRDPWTANPLASEQPALRLRIESGLERRIMRAASVIIANTAETETLLRAMVPEIPSDRFVTLTNGFDRDAFASIPRDSNRPDDCAVLLHSGHVYKHRSPRGLFKAVGEMRDAGEVHGGNLRIVFVGSSDIDLASLVNEYGLESFVTIRSHVPHRESLLSLVNADTLLLIQTGTQLQIPAKLYEYMAAGRPVLALTDSGAIARMVEDNGLGRACQPDDVGAIRAAMGDVIRSRHTLEFRPRSIERFRAEAIVGELAAILDGLAQRGTAGTPARASLAGPLSTR